jgi:hypothetical protein
MHSDGAFRFRGGRGTRSLFSIDFLSVATPATNHTFLGSAAAGECLQRRVLGLLRRWNDRRIDQSPRAN